MDHVTGKVWFAFLGAAGAWSAQLIIGYALMAHACYPGVDPLLAPTGGGFRTAATVVTLVALAVAVAALAEAWRLVAVSIGPPMGFDRATAESSDGGVPRYLAFAGVIIGIVFTLALVFSGIALIAEPTCRFA
jgi:hypothetical protein